MSANNELDALISLLNDTDRQVLDIVSKNLLERGVVVVSALEKAWEQSVNAAFQERIELLVHQIRLDALYSDLHQWVHGTTHDLLQGTCLLARYAFPELSIDDLREHLNPIIADAQAMQAQHATDLERVKALNHVLFDLHGFAQNSSNFYAPQNSYINQVLENKLGNPISLAVVYMLVAQAVGMPVYGVNLPKNFILAFGSETQHTPTHADTVRFYINPYNRGAVLSAREIEFFARQQKLPHREEYYLPCSNPVIVRRMLQNLVLAYQQQKNERRVHDFEKMKAILDDYLRTDSDLLG